MKLMLDNNTNMLYSPSFTVEKKLAYIEHFGLYGNKTRACKEIGITYATFINHYRQDEEFRKQLRSAVDAHTDAVEEVVLKMAKDPKGFKDRKLWLEAHRPEKYATKVRHEVSTKDDRLLGLLDKAKGYDKVIEASPIKASPDSSNETLNDVETKAVDVGTGVLPLPPQPTPNPHE